MKFNETFNAKSSEYALKIKVQNGGVQCGSRKKYGMARTRQVYNPPPHCTAISRHFPHGPHCSAVRYAGWRVYPHPRAPLLESQPSFCEKLIRMKSELIMVLAQITF